jgi:hypothetical protein
MTTTYLSSTYEDLKDHRQAVGDALQRCGPQVIAEWRRMRLPTAGRSGSAIKAGGLDFCTAMGLYPQVVSPVAALDMSGNVQEWCLNEYNKTERVELGGDASRVVRGRSWDNSQFTACATFRDHCLPARSLQLSGVCLSCTAPNR